MIVIQKISDALAKLKELEENENSKQETFWKELNELKLPIYLLIKDSKSYYIKLTMKFLNISGKYKSKIFSKRGR